MAKKKKKVVWHKKSGKMLSSSVLNPHGSIPKTAEDFVLHDHIDDRRKVFAQKLLAQIKKAVKQ